MGSLYTSQIESEVNTDHEERKSPEKKFLCAMLHRAVSDAIGEDREHRRSARDWINGKIPHCKLSFETVCDYLDINAEIVRDRVFSGKIAAQESNAAESKLKRFRW